MTLPMTRLVPCGSCRACCQNELVVLFPEQGDDPSTYEHTIVDDGQGHKFLALKMKPNGDCIYLGEKGCTIHDRAPAVCKSFDCRLYFLSMTRNDRRLVEKSAKHKAPIFEAARVRLKTLTPEQRQAAIRRRTIVARGTPREMVQTYEFGTP